jgi:hypothetical protein
MKKCDAHESPYSHVWVRDVSHRPMHLASASALILRKPCGFRRVGGGSFQPQSNQGNSHCFYRLAMRTLQAQELTDSARH